MAHPMSVIMDRRRYTGVTTTGYVIIAIAAVAIDPAIGSRTAAGRKFVHVLALERSGIEGLSEGQTVAADASEDRAW